MKRSASLAIPTRNCWAMVKIRLSRRGERKFNSRYRAGRAKMFPVSMAHRVAMPKKVTDRKITARMVFSTAVRWKKPQQTASRQERSPVTA